MKTKEMIRLLKGEEILSYREYQNFEEGDTIWGNDSDAEELKVWEGKDKEEAKKELEKYKCSYLWGGGDGNIKYIEEYALEYYLADEDGEFYQGSNYDLAEKEEEKEE